MLKPSIRRSGFFAQMMLSHDLKMITRNAEAEPDILQKEVVNDIGKIVFFSHHDKK